MTTLLSPDALVESIQRLNRAYLQTARDGLCALSQCRPVALEGRADGRLLWRGCAINGLARRPIATWKHDRCQPSARFRPWRTVKSIFS